MTKGNDFLDRGRDSRTASRREQPTVGSLARQDQSAYRATHSTSSIPNNAMLLVAGIGTLLIVSQ